AADSARPNAPAELSKWSRKLSNIERVPFLSAVSLSSCYSLDGFDLADMPILALKFGTKAEASGLWKFLPVRRRIRADRGTYRLKSSAALMQALLAIVSA
ncbi:MAG: hypothetical protein WA406_12080, partial [Pseudolabrys sp.]